MQLNPSEISELLKQRIEGMGLNTNLRTEGTVVSVTDGICRVHGLSDVMQGEMLEFPNNTYGLALNLERDSGRCRYFGRLHTYYWKATSLRLPAAFCRFPSDPH